MASKMISVSVPEDMLPEIDSAARREHRSRSELIREAVRRYLTADRGRILPVDDAQSDEIEAIEATARASGRQSRKGRAGVLPTIPRHLPYGDGAQSAQPSFDAVRYPAG